MFIFIFHLEKDDDQKPMAVAQSKDKAVKFDPDELNESHSAKKVSLADESEDIDMEPVDINGDENESGRIVNLTLFYIENPYIISSFNRLSEKFLTYYNFFLYCHWSLSLCCNVNRIARS
jgi:hypothetical protein